MRDRELHAMTHINTFLYSSLNQSEASPFTRWVPRIDPRIDNDLYVAIDESGSYFRDAMMTKFEEGMHPDHRLINRLHVVRRHQTKQWDEVWWEVWWWANSEEKARAKIERWVT